MKNTFYSYLDAFNEIAIIVPNTYRKDDVKKFFLFSGDSSEEIRITQKFDLGNEKKYICSFNDSISLNKDYAIYDELGERSYLRMGRVARTSMFEMMYAYDENDLGVTYYKEYSVFKIWSPVAKEIEVELIDLEGNCGFHDLRYVSRGVWEIRIEGDLDSYMYRYHIRVNELFDTCSDPNAVSSNANGMYNYVINPEKLYRFKYPKPSFSGKKIDAVIYEVSVRDFSIDESSGASHKGEYLGLIESSKSPQGHSTGLDYIASLGVTHIQLMPVFDFGGVDELDKDKYYNWGYNPVQFNVPEGWFASDPNDPYARINELRMLIDEAHKRGMRVVMDVVYNHVYEMDNFPFEKLVPGYGFRFDQNGIKTEISGCKNDIASERRMVRQFIVRSIKHWITNYNLSGFRFDLMGLLDIETMNKIDSVVKAYDPEGIVYGEGWNMPNTLDSELRSNMSNHNKMQSISHFNDRFRDKFKGSGWGSYPGFAMGGKYNTYDIRYLMLGSCVDGFMFFNACQTINYVECHDNFTFFDKMRNVLGDTNLNDMKYYQRLANQIVILALGVPFLHAGQEFFRSKHGVENSYNAGDDVNKIDWNLMDENYDSVLMVKDLISIRKQYREFRISKASQIKESVSFVGEESNNLIQYIIHGLDKQVLVVLKNNFVTDTLSLNERWELIFDGLRRVKLEVEEYTVSKPGIYLFVR